MRHSKFDMHRGQSLHLRCDETIYFQSDPLNPKPRANDLDKGPIKTLFWGLVSRSYSFHRRTPWFQDLYVFNAPWDVERSEYLEDFGSAGLCTKSYFGLRGTPYLLRLSVKRVRVPIPNLLSLVESEKPLSIALPSFSSSSRES